MKKMNKGRGFSLMELLIVVIIVGILASLAIPRYMKTTEASRAAEAYANLNAIRQAELAHYGKTFTYTTNLNDLNIENPNNIPNRQFQYSVGQITPTDFVITAMRLGTGPYAGNSILMGADGNLNESGWLIPPSTCFVKGTEVIMANGTAKPINEIKLDDLVLGYNGKKIEPGRVVKTMVHPNTKGYLLITREDGKLIKVTGEHLLFRGKDYKPASSLKAGESLFVKDNNTLKEVKIKSIVPKNEAVDVYCIEVAKVHNYFAQGVLVHNEKSWP